MNQEIVELLEKCLFAFNTIVNTHLGDEEETTTYELANKIENILKKKETIL